MRIITVFGLQRSGIHAVGGWLMANLGEDACYVNMCYPFSVQDLETMHAVPYDKVYSEHDIPPFGGTSALVLSFENAGHKDMAGMRHIVDSFCEETDCTHTSLLLLRDPINHMASLVWTYLREKKAEDAPRLAHHINNLVDMWITLYAPRAIALPCSDGASVCGDGKKSCAEHVIIYNRWNTDREYRDHLAAQIGFENEDLGFNSCFSWGFSYFSEGKSIDSTHAAYQSRYKTVQHPHFEHLQILHGPVLSELWKRVAASHDLVIDVEMWETVPLKQEKSALLTVPINHFDLSQM